MRKHKELFYFLINEWGGKRLHSEALEAFFQDQNTLYSGKLPLQIPSRTSHYEHSLSGPTELSKYWVKTHRQRRMKSERKRREKVPYTSICNWSLICSMPTANFCMIKRRAIVKSLTISNPTLCVLCAMGCGNLLIGHTRRISAQE